ncbi:hypothetical protein R3P38DRAFT_3188961 [Favolaschia claudopus]|uniref:Uncharacterized protein n=1 Tax=Favolaschia claudopus TaxID=2862362 RepID=A0AAW0BV52_9AGAR
MPLSLSSRQYSMRVEETMQVVTVAGKNADGASLNVKLEAMSDAKALEHLRTLVDASAMKENIPPSIWGQLDEQLATRGRRLLKGARHKVATKKSKLEKISREIDRLPKTYAQRKSGLQTRVAKMVKKAEVTAARMDRVGAKLAERNGNIGVV